MTATDVAIAPHRAGIVDLSIAGDEPLHQALVDRVAHACQQAERDCAAVVVWLTCAGEGAGIPRDPVGWPGRVGIDLVNRWERAVRRLERLPAPTLAVAAGRCRGGAAELMLAADYRLAGTDLRFSLGAAGAGAWPGMALYRLAGQLGAARARRLSLFGAELSASDALDWGLVDELTCPTLLQRRSHELVAELTTAAGADVSIRRRLIFDATVSSFEDAIGAHLAACDRSLRQVAAADLALVEAFGSSR